MQARPVIMQHKNEMKFEFRKLGQYLIFQKKNI